MADALAVLSPGPIPTTDYYFRTRAAQDPARHVRWIDTLAQAPAAALLDDGTDVVVVRHAPRSWLRLLARERARLGAILHFIDDDMRGALRARGLPRGYALRTWWRWQRSAAPLRALGAALGVSTETLARRHAERAPRVLPPLYLRDSPEQHGPQGAWFYHATAAHRREIEWLAPVVRAVQQRVGAARFEIVGDARTARLYRGIPRVTVRAPMPWPAYRALAARERFALGLAPCLDDAFNAARSHVKLFEITRFGAAGIYSARAPYAGVVRHGETGWLCGDRAEEWIETIVACLGDAAACARVHAAALAQCRAQAAHDATWP